MIPEDPTTWVKLLETGGVLIVLAGVLVYVGRGIGRAFDGMMEHKKAKEDEQAAILRMCVEYLTRKDKPE